MLCCIYTLQSNLNIQGHELIVISNRICTDINLIAFIRVATIIATVCLVCHLVKKANNKSFKNLCNCVPGRKKHMVTDIEELVSIISAAVMQTY